MDHPRIYHHDDFEGTENRTRVKSAKQAPAKLENEKGEVYQKIYLILKKK